MEISNDPENKKGHISTHTKPTHKIFSTVEDNGNIIYYAKNQVHGLCVGGDMVILFISSFQISGEDYSVLTKHTG